MALPDRFRLHPLARISGAAEPEAAASGAAAYGAEISGLGAVLAGAVLPEEPAGAVLRAALARAGEGLSFRIGRPDAPAPEDRDPPVFETLTSGSTGRPRRILRRQGSWWASFVLNAGLFGLGPGVRVGILGRLGQSLSLYGAVEGACLGCGLHLLGGMRPDRQRQELAARAVEVVYATPTHLRLLAEAAGPDLPALRLVISGGERVDAGLRGQLRRIAPGVVLRQFYGAAETSFITLADDGVPDASVGRAYPGVALSLRGPEGAAVAEGELGEVWVRSPLLFEGYAGDDPGGARWDGGWLSVGEMGVLRDGCLTLAGRAGRMVTIAGENVFPEAVEAVLAALPGVERAVVLARPDARRGSVLVAVLQGEAAREAEILRAARLALGPLRVPRAVVWRGDWPLLPSGKVDLARLAGEVGL